MSLLGSSRHATRAVALLMSTAVIMAASGCSTTTTDTNSAVGTSSTEVATSDSQSPGALGGPMPQGDQSPYPPSDCGAKSDDESLWKDVDGVNPKKKGPNIEVVEEGGLAYALHDGNRKGESHKYNLLVIPTARITGIECDLILNPKDVLNLWQAAWGKAKEQFGKSLKPTEMMLGINSKFGRSHDQLHIHLTGLDKNIRAELDKLTNVPTDLTKWNESLYVLGNHAYRIAHVKSLDTNPFNLLQEHVAKNFKDRFDQSLVVVADAKGDGFYLIATQGKPKVPNQPPHEPDLKIKEGSTTYYGTEAIDSLMYLG